MIREEDGDVALLSSADEAEGNPGGESVQVEEVGLFTIEDLAKVLSGGGVTFAVEGTEVGGVWAEGKAMNGKGMVVIRSVGGSGGGDRDVVTVVLELGGEGFDVDFGATDGVRIVAEGDLENFHR